MDDEIKNLPEPQPEQQPTDTTPESLSQSAFTRDTSSPDFAAIAPARAHKAKWRHKFSLKHLSKKQRILVIGGSVLLALLLFFGVWWFFLRAEPAQNVAAPIEPPTPTTEASRLTGLQVDPKVNKRHVTAVMIENSPDARPQSGLTSADIVFEAVAEAGITRFMALYQDEIPKYIGPIRSARPYYIDWLLPFDAGYSHVGGSPEALTKIKTLKVKDLDQFSNPSAYDRVSSRYAPHNVYSGVNRLDKIEKEKGYGSSNTISLARKEAAEPLPKAKAKTINLGISGPLYDVSFKYSEKKNSYARFMAGKKHVDEKSGKQISSKVVIALVVEKGVMPDGYHTRYGTLKGGTVFIFQDGNVIKGKWKKAKRGDQITFKKSDGSEIQLTPGKTWITVVSDKSSVSYK